MSLILVAVALTSTAFAQLSYKLYFLRGRRLRILAVALSLFVLAQVGFFLALTRLDVGVVYMATGLIHILVIGLSRSVLHERVTGDHLVAVTLIAGGLILCAL